MQDGSPLVRLDSAGVSVLIDLEGEPNFLHWGGSLGDTLPDRAAFIGPVAHSSYDVPLTTPLVALGTSGYSGRPSIVGDRAGRAYSPMLRVVSSDVVGDDGIRILLDDSEAELAVAVELHLSEQGMLRSKTELVNTGTSDYSLHALNTLLPVGPRAAEVLDLTGRWCRERSPQRQQICDGTWLRSTRHGRTGHDSPLLFAVGSAGFSNRAGSVWAVHLGFSGNQEVFVDRGPSTRPMIGAGELLSPGEVKLGPGKSYSTPWLYAAYSDDGIDGVTRIFHDWFRSRPGHPHRPRPVTLNTWEAVYFDHDLAALTELASVGAEMGVERFVLDDGWFRGRRDDTAGLGDWFVDEGLWPSGLTPLIEAVTGLGMEFGLWVEPEMIQEDSDVARAHPDWIARQRPANLPLPWRNQQVLDLVNPEAWNYIFERLDALLRENDISYFKWDQNRDLIDMGHEGSSSTHEQTLAVYRLLDALRAAHPRVEIESCSSGGARVDLGILERTDRVWASDCNDALERQMIQRWTSAVIPPELMGSHIGPATAHTTGRTHSLAFRAITALFGHFGIEWDIRELDSSGRKELTRVIALFKRHRGLLHSGMTINADNPDAAFRLHGVVAQDRADAVFAFVSLTSSRADVPGNVQFPGLDPSRQYSVTLAYPSLAEAATERAHPGWTANGFTASGQYLETVGLPMPNLKPERAILIELSETTQG